MLINIPFSPKFMQVFCNNEESRLYPLRDEFRAKARISQSNMANVLADKYYSVNLDRVPHVVIGQRDEFIKIARSDVVTSTVEKMRVASGALNEAELSILSDYQNGLSSADGAKLLERKSKALTEDECKAFIVLSSNPNAQCGFFWMPQQFLKLWSFRAEFHFVLPAVNISKSIIKNDKTNEESIILKATTINDRIKNGKDACSHESLDCRVEYRFVVNNTGDGFDASIDDRYSFQLDEIVFKRKTDRPILTLDFFEKIF